MQKDPSRLLRAPKSRYAKTIGAKEMDRSAIFCSLPRFQVLENFTIRADLDFPKHPLVDRCKQHPEHRCTHLSVDREVNHWCKSPEHYCISGNDTMTEHSNNPDL